MTNPDPTSGPDISVVVATFNRSGELPDLLKSLELQVGAPRFEVVIVDDCSTDATAEVLEQLAATTALDLHHLRTAKNSGPATARNLGWRAARGRLVAFTDDDCLPQPRWLASLARALARTDVVQGCTLPNPNHEKGPFTHTILRDDEHGYYETCNMGYRRSVLEQVGGFDEQFRAPFGEDTDLAWRAIAAGARTTFEAEALVWHEVRPGNLRSKLRKLPREAGVVLAVAKHPGLRAYTQTPLFFKRSHPRALGILAGIAILLVRPGFLTLGTCALLARPWVTYQAGIVGRRDLMRALPRLLILDLAQMLVLARASIRYRTIFL